VLLLKTFLTAAFGLLFVSTNLAQRHEENYSEIFSGNYQQAIKFLQTEKAIDSIILSHGLNPKEAVAVIFPELIRYNSIQDKIETFALETLYVQYGKRYANFSVGEFQIKPSFAEKLEIDFIKEFQEKKWSTQYQIKATDTIPDPEHRMTRLKKIKSKTGMAHYLCLFWKVMNSKYPTWKSQEEKIRFFATAYNSHYWASRQEIESFLAKKFFHTGLSMTSTKYNYADIAWYYFQQP
jgi:hypothetical protein